jgi:hypothetical protein
VHFTPNIIRINFWDMNPAWRVERAAWKIPFGKIFQFQNPCLTNTALNWRNFAESSEWPPASPQPQSRYTFASTCCFPNPWIITKCGVTSNYNRPGDVSCRSILHCDQLPEWRQGRASELSCIS